jgi:hypothetical protein
MYCRDTADAATAHLAALPNLKTCYAGQTHTTDRSLGILSAMASPERITLSACADVTNGGVAMLATHPRLRVTLDVLGAIPGRVQVNFEL